MGGGEGMGQEKEYSGIFGKMRNSLSCQISLVAEIIWHLNQTTDCIYGQILSFVFIVAFLVFALSDTGMFSLV